MKKLFIVLFGLSIFTTTMAETKSYAPGAEGNDNSLTLIIGKVTDIKKIPVEVYLNNPTTIMTAFSTFLKLPEEINVNSWCYDADEEEYIYDKGLRWRSGHAPVFGIADANNKEHAGELLISIASGSFQNLKDNEGMVITVYFDGSSLADGNYGILAKGSLAQSTTDKGVNINEYELADQKVEFIVNKGMVTGIRNTSWKNEKNNLYTLDGIQETQAKHGKIYIRNGKKILVK